jgi:hypothetical protein
MQSETLYRVAFRTVLFVPNDRMPRLRKLNSNLVATARLQSQLHQGPIRS